jgi:hypothetical protein
MLPADEISCLASRSTTPVALAADISQGNDQEKHKNASHVRFAPREKRPVSRSVSLTAQAQKQSRSSDVTSSVPAGPQAPGGPVTQMLDRVPRRSFGLGLWLR